MFIIHKRAILRKIRLSSNNYSNTFFSLLYVIIEFIKSINSEFEFSFIIKVNLFNIPLSDKTVNVF